MVRDMQSSAMRIDGLGFGDAEGLLDGAQLRLKLLPLARVCTDGHDEHAVAVGCSCGQVVWPGVACS
eukprot:365347-Chlamydomonas_euryale.AAC.5